MGKNDMIKTAFRMEGSHSSQLPPLDKIKGTENMTHRKGIKSDSTDQIIT